MSFCLLFCRPRLIPLNSRKPDHGGGQGRAFSPVRAVAPRGQTGQWHGVEGCNRALEMAASSETTHHKPLCHAGSPHSSPAKPVLRPSHSHCLGLAAHRRLLCHRPARLPPSGQHGLSQLQVKKWHWLHLNPSGALDNLRPGLSNLPHYKNK